MADSDPALLLWQPLIIFAFWRAGCTVDKKLHHYALATWDMCVCRFCTNNAEAGTPLHPVATGVSSDSVLSSDSSDSASTVTSIKRSVPDSKRKKKGNRKLFGKRSSKQ